MVTAMLAPKAVDRAPPKKDLRDPDSATDAGAVTDASPVAVPELLLDEPPPLVVLYAAAIEPSRGTEATNANRQNRRDAIMVADARVCERFRCGAVIDRAVWSVRRRFDCLRLPQATKHKANRKKQSLSLYDATGLC